MCRIGTERMLRSIDCGLTAPLGADLCWCALLDRTCLPVFFVVFFARFE